MIVSMCITAREMCVYALIGAEVGWYCRVGEMFQPMDLAVVEMNRKRAFYAFVRKIEHCKLFKLFSIDRSRWV